MNMIFHKEHEKFNSSHLAKMFFFPISLKQSFILVLLQRNFSKSLQNAT